jgi:cobalt-zinc-cadmium efflux system membrane fusion protein
MWAEIDIPEADMSMVQAGQKVTVIVDGIPGREFHGTLSYVAPEIDPHTRTVKGRVAIRNTEGLLRANMFGRAHIEAPAPGGAVSVPRSSVQRARTANLVFVRMAEDLYEARRVQVLHGDTEWVVVSGRIAPGDDVVTEGSFMLKTETLKESIGAGCCEVE